MSTLHKFRSGVSDDADVTKVTPQAGWNRAHVERCFTNVVLVAGQKDLLFANLASGFNLDEPDTNYAINITGNTDENFYWENKTTAGFRIRSSYGASTATVDVKVSRHTVA